jgi:hypothetical protein
MGRAAAAGITLRLLCKQRNCGDVRARLVLMWEPQFSRRIILADRNPIDFRHVQYAADAVFFYPAFGICSDRRWRNSLDHGAMRKTLR